MQKAGEDNTKWYILGGAAALLAAALVWQSYADEAEVENAEKFDNDDIKELLKKEKLDVVKKDGNMINAQYFLELLQFIITTVKKQDVGLKKTQIDKRRKAMADKDMDMYKSIVREMLTKEENDS